jgi:DNA repair protein RadC
MTTTKKLKAQCITGGPQLTIWEGAATYPSDAATWDPSTASTTEILAKLLGPSAERVCESLTGAYTDLRHLASAHPADLHAIGFPSAAIQRLTALIEFAKRFGEQEFVPGTPFRGSAAIYAHFRERLASEPVEYFYAVLVDNKHRKLRDVLVSKGSLSSSIVHPRDVYAQVIRHSAAAVIFCHNHPSGDPTPSKEDIEITRRLRDVGEIVGVRVLDHIVIGRGRYVSFVDDGYW